MPNLVVFLVALNIFIYREIVTGNGMLRVKDRAWSYKTPLPENVKIAGLVAFYNERADLIVDGERQVRPKTKFS
jgi:uncharacterized protein (DUF427 family)